MAVSEDMLLDEKLMSTAQSRPDTGAKRMWLVYSQTYFVTIATILGTGVLGLPVTLSKSGLYPFLISFTVGFFFQALLIVFFVDLLQRAHAAQLVSKKEECPESVPLTELDYDTFSEADDETENSDAVLAGHVIMPRVASVKPPNLHLLAELFLCCGVRQFFDLVIIVQFISLLICYALAGSEAYAELLNIPFVYVIPVFVWVLTLGIVFASRIIQPIVSLLTFAKGSLLLGTVIVTFMVGSAIHHEISNDYKYMGAPFLMGTVALGGVINVMPMLYSKVSAVRSQVRNFRTAAIGGLTTCFILNILWCWAVLDIVPQLNQCFSYTQSENNTFHILHGIIPQHKVLCYHNLSLEEAERNGEISTIPLTKIIQNLYPTYSWVAILVELFIMISITVSFLTIGAALHHTLSGLVDAVLNSRRDNLGVPDTNKKCCNLACGISTGLSLGAFTLVFGVAMYNPKSFAIVLEKAVSLLMNMEQGILVYFMLWTARNSEYMKLRIPLPLYSCVQYTYHLLPFYFGFAVVYDIYTASHDIIWPHFVHYFSDFQSKNLNGTWVYEENVTSTTSDVINTMEVSTLSEQSMTSQLTDKSAISSTAVRTSLLTTTTSDFINSTVTALYNMVSNETES